MYNRESLLILWRAWSARVAAAGVVVPFTPDLINLVIERWMAIAVLPTFTLKQKLWMCVAALIGVLLVRPLPQGNMPALVEAVARFYVPRTVQLATSVGQSVPVSVQVVPVDEHDPVLDEPVRFASSSAQVQPR
jgi:hypothetical protein